MFKLIIMNIRKANRKIKKHTPHVALTPIADVRINEQHREYVGMITKATNGNNSKFIPAKWGYGPTGPRKY